MSCQSQYPERVPQGLPGLSGEADHRIANSLTMISGLVRVRAARADSIDNPRAYLLEIAARIETVAQLHRLVAQSGSGTVHLGKYLHDICERSSHGLTADGASFSVDCSPDYSVPSTVALPLGLITAELYSNSLKYAHPAGLRVKVALSCGCSEGNRLSFVYEDDGVGFPEGFDAERDGNQGMQFIHMPGEQLDGTRQWQSDPLGVRFELVIPLSPA